ncbi:MAG: carboxythiazole phosphate tautomerase, partial [Planctomycetota bacterium]
MNATLLAISPGALEDEDALAFLAPASRARGAGLAAILVREPRLSDRAYLHLCERLRAIYDGGLLFVHDRPHLAAAVDADGVHLSWRGLPADVARAQLPSGMLVATSAHAGDDPAIHAASDHVLLGPVRPTPSKVGWKEPLGFDGLRRELARVGRPAWAVGGLRPQD